MNAGLDLIAARALLYAGTLVAFGLPAYLACTTPAARLLLEERRRVWRYAAIAAAAGLATTLVHLLLLTATMNGVAAGQVERDMLGFVALEMPVGRAALVRAVALAMVLLAALALRGRARIAACAVLGAVALASLGWNGHAMMNAGATGWAHLIADQFHLLAAGMWIGALIALLALTRASGELDVAARHEAFAGFSFVGTILVATLVLTGIVNSLMILVVPGGDTPARSYILLLALKIVFFLGALALAANNRFRLTPALARGGVDARLRRSVAVELAFIVATIVTVAVLGLLSPTE